jgi:hypothetical protein
MMLKKVLGVSVVRSGPYMVAKPSQVVVDVDGTSCPLQYPLPVGVDLAIESLVHEGSSRLGC